MTLPAEDIRPVAPQWASLVDLIEGARKRGFTEDQIRYLTSVVGIAWSKASSRAQAEERAKHVSARTLGEWLAAIDMAGTDLADIRDQLKQAYLAAVRLESQ